MDQVLQDGIKNQNITTGLAVGVALILKETGEIGKFFEIYPFYLKILVLCSFAQRSPRFS